MLKIFTSLLAIVSFLWIIYLLRKNVLYLSYSLFWIFVAFSILFLGLFPEYNIKLANLFGIEYYPIFPVIIAIIAIFLKLIKIDIEITKKQKYIYRSIQELAIYQSKIYRDSKKG